MTSINEAVYQQYHNSNSLISSRIARETLKYTALSAAYAGSLVIPLGLLILFCPKILRKSPIFPILVINLILGIALAFLVFIDGMHYVSKPLDFEAETSSLTIAITSMKFLIPILTDTVLIFKLLRLFPVFQYTRLQRISIVALPLLIKIPRLIVMALLANGKVKIFARGRSLIITLDFLMNSHLPLIEFSMQLASNLYCSVILLIKAYSLLYKKQGDGEEEGVEIYRSEAMMQRLRLMLKATLSSFLIPVCIQFALVIVYTTSDNLDVREPLQWTNRYVSLHCAVLATVWSSIGDATESIQEQQQQNQQKVFKKNSNSFIQLERDEIGEMPELYHKRSELSAKRMNSTNPSLRRERITTKRSASPFFCEGESVEITPNSYQLTGLHLAPPPPPLHSNDTTTSYKHSINL